MRTDCHRPGAIIPAEYSYCFSYFLGSACTEEPAWNMEALHALRTSGAKFAATGSAGSCSVCGAAYLSGDVWLHEPSGEHIHIGHECAAKYELLADRSEYELERKRFKEARAKECERARRQEARTEFLAAHPGLEEALKTNHHIIADIRSRFISYLTLSDKQIELVFKLAAEANAPKEAEALVPAPIGDKLTFEGVVVSTKVQEGSYGDQYRMTVKVTTEAGSWLAWGTIPASMLEAVPCGANGRVAALRGATVSMKATLKPGRDAHFALMSRPKGTILKLGV